MNQAEDRPNAGPASREPQRARDALLGLLGTLFGWLLLSLLRLALWPFRHRWRKRRHRRAGSRDPNLGRDLRSVRGRHSRTGRARRDALSSWKEYEDLGDDGFSQEYSLVWEMVGDADSCRECRSRDGTVIRSRSELRAFLRGLRCCAESDDCRCALVLLHRSDLPRRIATRGTRPWDRERRSGSVE
jgi:hypothetical protein